jgi:hypothetical protein
MKQLFVTADFSVGPILLSEGGHRRLPVLGESVCRLFETVENLTGALHFLPDDTEADRQKRSELDTLTTKTANYLVGQIESIVGELDHANAIVYEGVNNGFVCGSTGKPPVYIAQDAPKLPTIETIVSSGMIDADILTLVDAASRNRVKWADLFEDPKGQAEALGISISEKTAADLKMFAPSNLDQIDDAATREYIGFFHAVLEDGRYLLSWQTRPSEVADHLGIKLSDEVLEKILMISSYGSVRNTAGNAANAAIAAIYAVPTSAAPVIVTAAIAIGIAVTIGTEKAQATDRSGQEKL